MQLFTLLPALCLLGNALAGPVAVPVESSEIERSQRAKPADGRTVTQAWKDLESAYSHLERAFREVRLPSGPGAPSPVGAFGRSAAPAAHLRVLDVYIQSGRDFAPMAPLGIGEAANLWFPAFSLLNTIQTAMKTIKNKKADVKIAREEDNVRTMLVNQQREFRSWSSILVKVLPVITGQQNTGQMFIDRVLKEYKDVLDFYSK